MTDKDSKDLIARLRELADTFTARAYNTDPWAHLVEDQNAVLLRVAADRLEARDARITALEAEVVRLRGALEPFATWADHYRATTHDHYVPECEIDGPGHSLTLTFGDFRRARAALEGQS